MFELTQSFYFEAAHTLQRDIEREGSLRIHGHTYHSEVTISGEPSPVTGMLVDLGRIRAELERVRGSLDHVLLDDVEGLGPATLENLCAYIHKRLVHVLPEISAICVERRASGDRCVFRVPPRIGVTVGTGLDVHVEKNKLGRDPSLNWSNQMTSEA